ncbi:MAG: FtsX-like permease family protein, partial [Burkholderiales bacterium]
LLVGAGLLIRSLVRVLDVDMGFVASRAATIRVDPDNRYQTREQRNAYVDEVLRRVKAIPGVESAGITDALPLGRNRTWGSPAKGVTYERGRFPLAFPRIVSDGYVTAMGIPLRAGRDISAADTSTTEPVMLVNETMARTLWPGQDPIGKYVLGPCAKERRVVGVVGDVRHLALEQTSGNEMYLPMRQCTDQSSADLVVRSTLPPAHLAGAVRAALQPISANLPRNDFRTLQQLVDKSVSPRRFMVLLLGGFAVFAVVLASLGIYALVSYSVNQRTQEIGIRMALGASARDVQKRIILETLRLAIVGLFFGVGASWMMVRAGEGLLFGVTPRDPATFVGMAAVLMLVALAAGYLPARRASLVDPVVALRAE